MFENIVLRRPENTRAALDAGTLAEALFFYQNTHVVLEHGSLRSLLNTIGPQLLLSLLSEGWITVTYYRNSLGVHTDTRNNVKEHHFISWEFAGSKQEGRKKGNDAIIAVFERELEKSAATRRASKRFLDLIEVASFHEGFGDAGGVTDAAVQDMSDRDYVRHAAEITLRGLIPNLNLPVGWYFEPYVEGGGIMIGTNLDFSTLNSEYHKFVSPKHSSITPEFILSHILEARADLALASRYMAEYLTNDISSLLMQEKFRDILAKRRANAEQLVLFQDLFLRGANSIRDAINQDPSRFGEYLKLLEEGKKFKDWLRGKNPDAKLLAEYHRAATNNTWLEKLPTRTVRFALFVGMGLLTEAFVPTGLAAASAIGLSAADYFLIDNVIKGWRPNQFVEGPVADFLKDK